MKSTAAPHHLAKSRFDITLVLFRKAFNILFPKKIWIVIIAVAILLCLESTSILGYALANYIWFSYSVGLGVVLHEAGHFIAARLMGEFPWRITLGKGAFIGKWNFCGTKLVVHTFIFSGAVHTVYKRVTHKKMRRFVVILGGPLVNLLIAFLCLYNWPSSFFVGDHGIQWLAIFGLANLSLGLGNLVPFKSTFMGLPIDSDGRQLLRIPFLSHKELAQNPLQDEWLRANDLLEERQYTAALEIYKKHANELQHNKIQYINLAVLNIKSGQFEKAKQLLEDLLVHIDEPDVKTFAVYVHHNLAYIFLLLSRFEEAYSSVLQAKRAAGKFEKVDCLYAYILVEVGKAQEAISILEKNCDLHILGRENLDTAMYLASGYIDLGKTKKAMKIWNNIAIYEDSLEPDAAILFQRLAVKVREKKQGS